MSAPPNRLGEEKAKSNSKNSDEAVAAILRVVTNYNGIVRSVIELIDPQNSKFGTRRSNNNSTVMYLSQVLKGLIEPLKHMIFQLSQVHDTQLSGMLNMVVNLVTIIDQSPPFKMIDIKAYKEGDMDYTGLSDDLDIFDFTGYIALLKMKIDELKTKKEKYSASLRPTLSLIPESIRSGVADTIKRANEDVDKAIAKAEAEIINAKAKRKAKVEVVKVDPEVTASLDDILAGLDAAYQPVIDFSKFPKAPLYNYGDKPKTEREKSADKQKRLDLKKLKKILHEFENVPSYINKETREFDINLVEPENQDDYTSIVGKIRRLERELRTPGEKAAEESQVPIVRGPRVDSAGNELPEAAPPGGVQEGAPVAAPPREIQEGGPEVVINTGIDIAGNEVGKGSGKPLADLLANPKQQYNSMQRPISDDQKINNDMINMNRNWQLRNNHSHDTPLGNLNPFLAQDASSKYTFEALLAKQNSVLHPETNARGADISLLQGPIATVEGSGKKSKALMKLKKVAIDEKNDPYKKVELASNGMIPEEKEDQFKLPDLKPKKRK